MHKYLTISLGAILFIFSNAILAEVNLFEKNFQRQSPKDFQSFAPKVDTKIMRGWEEKSDNIKMLEDGYDLLALAALIFLLKLPENMVRKLRQIWFCFMTGRLMKIHGPQS